MIYLSPTTKIPERYDSAFGIMFSAVHPIGGLDDALVQGKSWMMDNNAFTKKFKMPIWLGALEKYRGFADSCLGIPVPDVVGDYKKTLALFYQHRHLVVDHGLPVAFVTQDGLTPEETPWGHFSTLFVGGSDKHKLSVEAGLLIAEAKRRGKWVHIGRVNSAKRLKQKFWMADSVDGTTLIKAMLKRNDGGRDRRGFLSEVRRLHSAVNYCNRVKAQEVLL